ncbi:MAG: serine/threonine-protein kinase [Gammaproteobacteria bacterium]|nr:serine/threonine-protein kinase [Gammaproteobacteria bacterium]
MDQHRRLYFSLFIVICFLLALLSSQNGTVRWIDAQMFSVASHLLPAQSPTNDLRVIQLDESRLQKPEGIKEFRTLLRKLKKSGTAEIIWLSDDIPQMDYVQAGNGDAWKTTQGERNKLAWMLENQRVFLTQYTNIPGQQNSIPYSESLIYQDGWRQYIPPVFLPQVQAFRLTNTRLPYRVYPFNPGTSDHQALIWYDQNGQTSLPDLSLAVFSRSGKSEKLHWDGNGVIDLGGRQIPVSLAGKVFNYFSKLTGRHTDLNALPLKSASAKPNSYYKNKIALIGQDANRLQLLADSLGSLQAGATYHTPSTSWWLMPLLLGLVVVYLLWPLPLLSKQSGLFLGAFLVLGIIAAQPVLLILKGIWWPSINLLMLMLVGQIAVYVYLSGQSILDQLLQKQLDAWYALGHYQFENNDLEKAATNLLKCDTNDRLLADLYEIGVKLERKRKYDQAFEIYTEISHRQKNYKDINKKLESHDNVKSKHSKTLTLTQAQKTLLMSQMELPELGRYTIEKELGRGAMGVVYLARDPKINRKVAIKTLDYSQFSSSELKTVKERFFREAEAAGRLSHGNIVTVFDMGEEEDFAFIAMDYVTGVPLSNYTKPSKLLAVEEVYRIVKEVAEGLDYAHGQKIVHRDIKPANIMYNSRNKVVKITDFGIARITDSVKTRTGAFLGSPSYMAPEQLRGSNVDGRADIYSLGASFYQLLTGQLPFDADNLGNLAYKIANEKHKTLNALRSDLPASATRIINKALQKERENRYASGAEMAKALKRDMLKQA